MRKPYKGVITRFLNTDERFIQSDETEMPLVIEAKDNRDLPFLKKFLKENSEKITSDIAHFGAILLRGFDIKQDLDFEEAVLSIDGFKGIKEAFMAEEGRIHVPQSEYVLFTNAVYKTGGTLYLGGFHSENYYSADVPAYICFCCFKPSQLGGETGLINMEKIYQSLPSNLKHTLEKNNCFAGKWRLTEVAHRYQISLDAAKNLCEKAQLPVIGEGEDSFVLMYKPNIFHHPKTGLPSFQINLFELPTLNTALRKIFSKDYQGKEWFWHRFVWRFPEWVFKVLETVYVALASFFYSPKNSINILKNKIYTRMAGNRSKLANFENPKVRDYFNEEEIDQLANLVRKYYVSCLWKPGDILLVDNRKVMHAGMPGKGTRLVRALIANVLDISYFSGKGSISCNEKTTESVGSMFKQNKV